MKKRVKAKVAKQEAGDELTDDENETIEAAARRGADVVALHKTSVSTGRQLIDGMFRELLSQHTNRDLLAELVEQHCDDIGEKLTAVVQKVVSLPTRAGTARDLAQALERVVRLERQAYSLDDDGGDQAGGLADALQKARKRAQTIENE